MTDFDTQQREIIYQQIESYKASTTEQLDMASEATCRLLAAHIYGNLAMMQVEREKRLVEALKVIADQASRAKLVEPRHARLLAQTFVLIAEEAQAALAEYEVTV